ncbi:MAG TPA: hypothetical protein VGG40_04405 [Solirubrobacterales bacterium]|jgi:hypothetical protein
MSAPRRIVLPLIVALAVVGLGALVAGCGSSSDSKHVEEGEVMQLGPLKYQVTFSRYLNLNDSEDAAYLAGREEPKKGMAYFGIWLEVQNETEDIQKLPAKMTITDLEDHKYEAIESESEFAFPLGGTVEGEEQIPVLDSPAQQGPLQSSIVIFEISDESGSERPLILHFASPEGEKGEVQLDL